MPYSQTMLEKQATLISPPIPRVRWSQGFPQQLEGIFLLVMRVVLACAAVYAVLTNLAGLGFRVALLSSGETAALFRDNELFLGLRVGSSAVVALVYCTFGVVLAWYKSHEGFAALTALTLLTTAITVADLSSALDVAWVVRVHPVFSALNTALLLYLLLLFPHNRFRSSGSILLGHGWLLFCLSSLLFPALPFNVVYFESWGRTPLLSLLFDFTPFVLAFGMLLYRVRGEAAGTLRSQRRWFLYGTSALFLGLLLNFALRALPAEWVSTFNLELVRPFGLNLLLLVLPLSLGIAHYRHGLFGGEVVVEHTLTHLTLAAVLVGFYVVLVRLLENFSVDYGSSLVIVASAASFALLLQPLSNRIRRTIGHRLHGTRGDPYQVLSSLSGRLELSGNPGEALAEIGHTLEHTFNLVAGGMELQLGTERRSVYRWGAEGRKKSPAGMRQFSLVSDGEVVGVLWVVSEREQFSQQELDLLREVSRHTGRVMQSLRLQLELQRSREQRVEGFEAELKRLRNDLHDGIAPSLVGLARHLDVALDVGDSDPEKQILLENVQRGLLDSVRDLRRIIYGLRPPALDELGLVGALGEFVGRSPLSVKLELPERLSISAAAEVALYRIATEALNNVQKHANAQKVWVRLRVYTHLIELSIEDDGQGLIPGKSGIGIRSMREWAEELGGKLLIHSSANSTSSNPTEPVHSGPPSSSIREGSAREPNFRGTVIKVSLPLNAL